MHQLMYIMQFKGYAAPVGASPHVLTAITIASSCTITTAVGAEGVDGTLQPMGGGKAAFASEVTFRGETAFQESGSITFRAGGHRLAFSTVGEGYLGPSAAPRLKQGAVTWQVDGGEGQFAGASGLITSNFFVSATGEVTDHHFGVLFVPEGFPIVTEHFWSLRNYPFSNNQLWCLTKSSLHETFGKVSQETLTFGEKYLRWPSQEASSYQPVLSRST
jgi:hypothetical protein